ncbi:MAG TPA: ABC transporter ATP-binding protein [Candidatus Limiplasma sp.]|nr:ABC transporter ATP-binding protein [Candidatus Limiplasma sp.]
MTTLNVENVSICYRIGDFQSIGLKEYLMRKLTHTYFSKKFWAVKDVSFSLDKSDMLGIIGSNGAGKSTLLKAISGVMTPSNGTIQTQGKVVAFLELASGFDGDLTVKENTYLRGALLGYSRSLIDEQYDNIIAYAGLGEFADRPFRQLSSGMKSRLAFAIASLVQPDILILDEVLSVGDGAFQAKSEKRMKEIINAGSTTILVSHSLPQVRNLCNKVLWLDHGKQVAFGPSAPICARYEEFLRDGKLPEPLPWTDFDSYYYSRLDADDGE